MIKLTKFLVLSVLITLLTACDKPAPISELQQIASPSAAEILGNPDYPAISYGGYRDKARDTVPSEADLTEDMKILGAMGIKVLRTYNTSHYPQASRLLAAIRQLKLEDPSFEMYVMLGAWIDCENAWTDNPNHHGENLENNSTEIATAVALANQYPDIVKVIAVGNEAMVHWAATYFVYPDVILKWVNYLQGLKQSGELSADLWITSSENYAAWGGGAKDYRTEHLAALVKAVDFLSVHTYPFHDTHYNPDYWGVLEDKEGLSELQMIEAAMLRAKQYAISQHQGVADYIHSLGVDKPIHIGETGWASIGETAYGFSGSKAADEVKQKLYHKHMRDWANAAGMSMFYFEAFDEQWKDPINAAGSENHFGLITLNSEVKYALWDLVDQGAFVGLTRNGKPITKSYGGDQTLLMQDVQAPPLKGRMEERD